MVGDIRVSEHLAGARCLTLLIDALLFGVNGERAGRGRALCRNDGAAEIARQRRSKRRHVVGNSSSRKGCWLSNICRYGAKSL
jgi:hypothetical protein